MSQQFEIGQRVKVVVPFCEVTGMTGTIKYLTDSESMPYMVMLDNYREWPFAAEELENV